MNSRSSETASCSVSGSKPSNIGISLKWTKRRAERSFGGHYANGIGGALNMVATAFTAAKSEQYHDRAAHANRLGRLDRFDHSRRRFSFFD